MDEVTPLTAGKRSATLDRTRAYMGDPLSFLIWGKETGGRINLIEAQVKAGNEPPPHYHAWENEVFYVLEGEVEVFCEGISSFVVGPNELAFIPQGLAHALRFHSPHVRMLTMIQAMGDHSVTVDEFFVSMSEPAKTLAIDAAQTTDIAIDPEKLQEAAKLAAEHGAFFLSPEDTAQRLPDFPVFGANLT